MRDNISLLLLLAKASFSKILGMLVLMVAAETGLFYLFLSSDRTKTLEAVIRDSRMVLVFLAAFCFTMILSAGGLNGRKASPHYTLHRLRTGKRQLFFCESLYYGICYLMLLAAQAAAALLLCRLYVFMADPSLVSGQTIVLAFYRSPFFHSILPLADWFCWTRNLVLLVCLGLCTAYASWCGRRNQFGIAFLLLATVCGVTFVQPVGEPAMCIMSMAAALACTLAALLKVLRKEENPDET